MPIEFGSTKGAYFISTFRAFVHDNGMPGVRLANENGEFVDVVFSVAGTQELQKQLSLALELAASFSASQH